MNIFKVLASGKKPMYEEQMSSILAWLLHPQMEHGLGYELLSRFVASISCDSDRSAKISDNLHNRLRGDAVSDFGMELEEYVTTAYIDILISIDSWKLAIENKIYPGSTMENQLNKEYVGLISKYENSSCVLIYLVPTDDFGELHRQVWCEYDSFDKSKLRSTDFLKLMTWQENNAGYPSIVQLLEGLLQDEAVGKTEPISEYTRHTIKALIVFIRGGFSGYDYERINIQNEVYPKIKGEEILNKMGGFVGIKSGIAGLIGTSTLVIQNRVYQYSESEVLARPSWVSVYDFKQIYLWKTRDVPPIIEWDRVRLKAMDLYTITSICSPTQSLFIGIKGGLPALNNMDKKTIKESTWQLIAADEPPNNQWISGEEFARTLELKGIT
ncbi:MAG: PD-(D/E)XK nuclease family protein [Oscillospiraceae bacterium]|nr:PD-(D/E)XK nuclease family protein [Oscillospiraceae bacterium]